MEKLKSSLLNMVLVLVGVAMVIGAVLAWVNNITEKPIADKAQQTLANGIRDVMGTADINVDEPDSLTLDLQGKAYDFVIHNVNSTSGDYLGAAVESTTLDFALSLLTRKSAKTLFQPHFKSVVRLSVWQDLSDIILSLPARDSLLWTIANIVSLKKMKNL